MLRWWDQWSEFCELKQTLNKLDIAQRHFMTSQSTTIADTQYATHTRTPPTEWRSRTVRIHHYCLSSFRPLIFLSISVVFVFCCDFNAIHTQTSTCRARSCITVVLCRLELQPIQRYHWGPQKFRCVTWPWSRPF